MSSLSIFNNLFLQARCATRGIMRAKNLCLLLVIFSPYFIARLLTPRCASRGQRLREKWLRASILLPSLCSSNQPWMREGQRVPCPSPFSTSAESCCSPSGRDNRVGGLQDDVSHLVGMGEKRDMAGRDLTRRDLAPLRHPAVLLGMDHAIL